MRVLEITCEPILHGGQEAFIFNCLANMPDNNNLRIDVLTLYYCKNDNYRNIVEKRGGNLYELNIDFKPGKSRRLIIKPLYEFFKNHKFDIVHIHSGSISALAYAAETAKKSGIKNVIVHSHSTGVDNLRHKVIHTMFSSKLYNNVSAFCACSVEAGKMKFPSSVLSDLIVLKNGIDLDKFAYNKTEREKIRETLSIPHDAYLVGQIGRFTFEKNHEFMIDIANNVVKKDASIYFLFIGDGELRKSCEEKAKSNSNIKFLDAQNDIYRYYSVLDLFVLPSLYEGIPLVSIEAQANHLPIYASTGVSEEIEINDNVERISLNNTDEWIKKILNKPSRDSEQQKLKDSGWSIDSVVDKVINLYKQFENQQNK